MSDPDFSIITPSYNYARFIGECLESVVTQEGVTFEHIVIDAGSKDNTAEVVARFPHAIFSQEPDKGMSDGINKGFRRAKGKWVMWLNADDRLKPGALAMVKRFAELESSADVIYGGWDFVGSEGTFQRRMTLFPFDRMMLLYAGCYIGSTACFYRRSTTIDAGHLLNVSFHYCMDGEYYARLASEGKRFVYLPAILADFRLHGESLSQRNLDSRDMDGILRLQRQFAEPRAVRRIHGISVTRNESVNGIIDGVLNFWYRGVKGLKRRLHAGRSFQ